MGHGYQIYFKSSEYVSRQWTLRTRSKFFVTNWLKNLQILFTFWKRYVFQIHLNQIVHVILCSLSNLWSSTIFLSIFKYYLVVLSVNWFLVMLLLLSFQLELHRSYEENDMPLYELKGLETLGSMLRIVVQDCAHVDFSNSSIQWFRIQPEGSKKEIISGWAIFILQSTNIFWRWYISDICCY